MSVVYGYLSVVVTSLRKKQSVRSNLKKTSHTRSKSKKIISVVSAASLMLASISPAVAGGQHGVDISKKGQDGGSHGFSTFIIGGKGKDGGNGADGANINHTNNINADTTGNHNHGLNVTSTGGNGGNGGSSGGIFGAKAGNGGKGGDGGDINLRNKGDLSTDGHSSHGINASSQGGNGGKGATAGSLFGSVSGSGGSGGRGGNVTVNNDGNITTSGNSSYGINATSFSGNGGNGGSSGSLFFSNSLSGGESAGSGNIEVTNNGIIRTDGKGSHGINAETATGSGGSGSHSLGILIGGIGGNGGGSQASGTIAITNTGEIHVKGDGAHGINAVARTGSGGNSSWGGGLFFGASHGAGNSGSNGSVTVTNRGTITTSGKSSHGINAETHTGQGGSASGALGILFGLGGKGGNAGTSGAINITNSGDIQTSGDGSYGINATGNGGNGGKSGWAGGIFGAALSAGNGGAGGAITIDNSGTIITSGAGSHGINAQNTGGKGGDGKGVLGLIFGLGGHGGKGGAPGDITIRNNGDIHTKGSGAYGINAVANGGAGGQSGWAGGFFGIALSAGSGANGGVIDITNTGTIITEGAGSHGINAENRGGDGGNGKGVLGIILALAGHGGDSGNGGLITINNEGDIQTSGDGSHAINAKTIGGTGGSAGWAGGIFAGALPGGKGLGDGAITINNKGTIVTGGDNSHGINAHATGSNGGGSKGVVGLLIGHSSHGGDSEAAGNITINNEGSIVTSGSGSHAINAVSEGGRGGGGGWTFGLIANIAGSGGHGGDGGVVHITDVDTGTDRVFGTAGDEAHAIVAESKGGSGGNGGNSFGFHFFIGGDGSGSGGDGGNGGQARVDLLNANTQIGTLGNDAHGVNAKSTGGNGGNAGGSYGFTLGAVGSIGIGNPGDGGDGGNGGIVNVTSHASIFTEGDNSYGINAVSSGGEGGKGGTAGVGSVAIPIPKIPYSGSLALGLSGDGGDGGNGGTVTVNNEGQISTKGNGSHALNAQSLGGKGGDGGLVVSVAGAWNAGAGVGVGGRGGHGGNGGTVNVTNNGTLYTQGNSAHGVNAVSAGGKGGKGGAAVGIGLAVAPNKSLGFAAAVSGAGGNGGNAGNVTVTSNDKIITKGEGSHGINAQSKGGDGGDGNVAVAVSASLKAAINVAKEGQGGKGGDGATTTVNNTGVIATSGKGSHGINAGSSGGNGGDTDLTVSVSLSKSATLNLDFEGKGGDGGNGSQVTVRNDGVIYTAGDGSNAINAISNGGNGGNGGMDIAANTTLGQGIGGNLVFGASGGHGGSGGMVSVTNNGDIVTTGTESHGIRGRSKGGNGGKGGDVVAVGAMNNIGVNVSLSGDGGNGGNGGDVTLDNHGTIYTTGNGSVGMYGSSEAGNGGDAGKSIGIGVGGIQLGAPGKGKNQVAGSASQVATSHLGGNNSGGSGGFLKKAIKDLPPGQLTVGIGGQGGKGGNAGVVNLTNKEDGVIITEGNSAHGIKGASNGGSGGKGGDTLAVAVEGFSISGDIKSGIKNFTSFPTPVGSTDKRDQDKKTDSSKKDKFKPQSANISVTVAGNGGDGGQGGTANVVNLGNIRTSGDNANGIYLESNGGNGGNGGHAGLGDPFWGDGVYGLNLNFEGEGVTDFGEDAELGFGGAFASGTGQGSVGIGVSKGGDGGTGGNAGYITGRNDGYIWTEGNGSAGIKAHAAGGNGGRGGIANAGAIAIAADTSTSIAVAVGGYGGDGGNGGTIQVTNTGQIVTSGIRSAGIDAVSAGGQGGAGGDSRAFYLQRDQSSPSTTTEAPKEKTTWSKALNDTFKSILKSPKTLITNIWNNKKPSKDSNTAEDHKNSKYGFEMTVALGGSGGNGGDGGSVTVDNSGVIFTESDFSAGINAQSVGGNGGAGGDSTRGIGVLYALYENESLSPSWATLTNPKVNVGGEGGNGGHGGQITINNRGVVYTKGNYSSGIDALSIGGNGGAGGTGDSGYIGDFSVGGQAGAAGNGGAVTVSNLRTSANADLPLIVTEGDMSNAITAVSAGGTGGDGGDAKFGGNWSFIYDAINAGRIKGLGPDGATKFIGKILNPRLGIAISANGADGGRGDRVIVNSEGVLSTSGDSSHGILAQSTGGNGGRGGDEYLTNYAKIPYSLVASGVNQIEDFDNSDIPGLENYGGFGGNGGDGDLVQIAHNGEIYATGNGSHGIVAQSTGGRRGENGKTYYAPVIDIPDISNVDFSTLIEVDYHNRESNDGDGGDIVINGDGLIFVGNAGNTEASIGILAQSISGAQPDMKVISEKDPNGDGDESDAFDLNGDGKIDGSIVVPTGGRITSRPGNGKGGAINVDRKGAIISAYGDGVAVLLESSGEQGGGDITFNFERGSNEITLSDAADAKDYNGYIIGGTGQDAAAILIRGGNNNTINLGAGTTVYSGNYRTIISEDSLEGVDVIGNDTINNSGKVIGNVDLGRGKNTFNNNSGAEFVTYEFINLGSTDNYLVNKSGALINPYGLDVGETRVTGGYISEAGSAMRFDVEFGATRTPFVPQTGTATGNTSSGSSGNYSGTTGNSQTPNVDFINMTKEEILEYFENNKPSVDQNSPVINGPDKPGEGFASNQFDTDTNDTDDTDDRGSNPAGTDLITFTGGVYLSGTVYVDLLQLSQGRQTVIISEQQLVVDPTLKIEKVFSSAAITGMDWEVVKDGNGHDNFVVKVETNIRALPNMANQRSVGGYLDQVVMESSLGAEDELSSALTNIVRVPEGKEELIVQTLDTLHSEPYLSQLTSGLFSDLNFTDQMSRCDSRSSKVHIVNGNCIWGQAQVRYFNKGSSYTSFGIDEDTHAFSGGYQKSISENMIAGVSLHYENGTLKVEDRLYSKLKAAKAGAFVKYLDGPLEVTFGGHYGYGWYENSRNLKIASEVFEDGAVVDHALRSFSTKGESTVQSAGLQLQLAYMHRVRQLYFKPFVDLRANYLEFDKFSEDGMGGLDLRVEDTGNWLFSVKPGIEIGGNFQIGKNVKLRPHLMLGVIFFDDSKLKTGTLFEGSPGDVTPFEISSEFDDTIASIEAGLDLQFENEGIDLKLKYQGKFSDDIDEHTGSVNFSIDF